MIVVSRFAFLKGIRLFCDTIKKASVVSADIVHNLMDIKAGLVKSGKFNL